MLTNLYLYKYCSHKLNNKNVTQLKIQYFGKMEKRIIYRMLV